MTHNKFRIGKNFWGWFIAIPQGWGGYHVLEDVGSFENAVAIFNHCVRTPTDGWRWM